jgi:hypothetical protein
MRVMAASLDGASREQISLLASDQVTASSRSPGSFRVSTKKSKNGATIGTPLEPGKFCRADNRHNIGCCDFSGVDRLHKNRHNSKSNVSNRHSRILGKNQAP